MSNIRDRFEEHTRARLRGDEDDQQVAKRDLLESIDVAEVRAGQMHQRVRELEAELAHQAALVEEAQRGWHQCAESLIAESEKVKALEAEVARLKEQLAELRALLREGQVVEILEALACGGPILFNRDELTEFVTNLRAAATGKGKP